MRYIHARTYDIRNFAAHKGQFCLIWSLISWQLSTVYVDCNSNVILVVEIRRWWVLKSKILCQKSIYSKEIIVLCEYNEWLFFKKMPKSDFQSEFLYQESSELFIQLKSNNLGAHFCYNFFFDNFNFWRTLFYKIMPNFSCTVIHCI